MELSVKILVLLVLTSLAFSKKNKNNRARSTVQTPDYTGDTPDYTADTPDYTADTPDYTADTPDSAETPDSRVTVPESQDTPETRTDLPSVTAAEETPDTRTDLPGVAVAEETPATRTDLPGVTIAEESGEELSDPVVAKKDKIFKASDKTSKGTKKASTTQFAKSKTVKASKKQLLGVPGYDNEEPMRGVGGYGGGGLGGGLGGEMEGIPLGMGAGAEPLGFAGPMDGPQRFSPGEGPSLMPNSNEDDSQLAEDTQQPGLFAPVPQEEEAGASNEQPETVDNQLDGPAALESRLQGPLAFPDTLPALPNAGFAPNTIPGIAEEDADSEPNRIPGLSNVQSVSAKEDVSMGPAGIAQQEQEAIQGRDMGGFEPSYLGTLMKNAGLDQYDTQSPSPDENLANAIGKPISLGDSEGSSQLQHIAAAEGRFEGQAGVPDMAAGFMGPAMNGGPTAMNGGFTAMNGAQAVLGVQAGLKKRYLKSKTKKAKKVTKLNILNKDSKKKTKTDKKT